MKIVDLDTAQNLLHRTTRGPSLSQPVGGHKEHQPPPPPHHGPPMGSGGDMGYNPPRDQFHGPPRGRDDRGRGAQPLPPPQGDYNRIRVS